MGTIYKHNTIEVDVLKTHVTYAAHIKNYIEEFAGAHYYMQSPYTANYNSAMAVVDLSNVTMNLKNRVAFISFNFSSQKCSVDMGIKNTGNGWQSFYFSPTLNKEASGGETQNATQWKASDLKKVSMSMDFSIVNGKHVISCYYTFFGINNSVLKKSSLSLSGTNFFDLDANGKNSCRFIRFVSLIPANGNRIENDKTNDGSYIQNIKFTSLQLYNHVNKKYEVWDINSNTVQHGWKAQARNIILSSSGATDNVSINHSYKYH